MNIFQELRIYQPNWVLTNSRKLNDAELSSIVGAETVLSTYGISVKFTLKNGGMSFIPLSQDSTVGEGVALDIHKIELETLTKGDDIIYRIKA